MVNMVDIERYLGPSQAAIRCECSARTITNLAEAGKLR